MQVNIDWDGEWARAVALPGASFSRVKDTLAKCPGRKPIFDSRDRFQYWRIPRTSINWLVSQFGEENITGTARELIEAVEDDSIPLADLPREELKAVQPEDKLLLPYQLSFVVLPAVKKVLLASMPTGTGKSFTALMRAKQVGFNRLLIVGPKKLAVNWRTEVREAYGIDPMLYYGSIPQRTRLRKDIDQYNVFYTTFEQLGEFSKYAPTFDHIIIDEIHIICNPKTQSHKVLYSLVQGIPYRTGLSATPMRLRMKDLWGVLRLLDANIAGDRNAFLEEYEEVLATMPINRGSYVLRIPIKVRSKNEDQLRHKLSSIMYRPSKEVSFKDHIDIVDTELTPRQARLYRECLLGIQLELSQGKMDVSHALARMTRLLQISEGVFNIDSVHEDSGKLEYIADAIRENLAAGNKTVIWSRFEPITRKIYDLFPKETVVYSGKVSESLRSLGVWAFNGTKNNNDKRDYDLLAKRNTQFTFKPGEAQVFAGTHALRSGIGINLEAAHLVYFTSFDWNPHVIFQTRDRVSRLTQTVDTQTYFLVSEKTIERKALRKILTQYESTARLLDGSGSQERMLARDIVGLLNDTV